MRVSLQQDKANQDFQSRNNYKIQVEEVSKYLIVLNLIKSTTTIFKQKFLHRKNILRAAISTVWILEPVLETATYKLLRNAHTQSSDLMMMH
jgi:hypothetical protein